MEGTNCKVAVILCLALFALTSSIKFAGDACKTAKDCAQKEYGSECMCEMPYEDQQGHDHGECMDPIDPKTRKPIKGACMTKYKYAQNLKKKGKAESTGPKTPETLAYKTEKCDRKEDCFTEPGVSKCLCHPRKGCFGGQCLKREEGLPAAKKVFAKRHGIPPPKKKALRKSKRYANMRCCQELHLCVPKGPGAVCSCEENHCVGECKDRKKKKKKRSALFGDLFHSNKYGNTYDDGMGYITLFIFIFIAIVTFCMCCVFCIGLNVIGGYVGYYVARGNDKNYKLIQRNDVTDAEQNDILA